MRHWIVDIVIVCSAFPAVQALLNRARQRNVDAKAWMALNVLDDPRSVNDSTIPGSHVIEVGLSSCISAVCS